MAKASPGSAPFALPNVAATAQPDAFLRYLERHKKKFEARLRQRLERVTRRFPRLGTPALDTLRGLVVLCERGGKRVRPGLLMAGAECIAAQAQSEPLWDAAVALELLHGYFLVHDDWMDGDLIRRGGPSVHAMLRRRFGDDHLGDSAAILAGDWGVAVATLWMGELDVSPPRKKAALGRFAEMQLAAVAGQIRDLVADDDDAERTYRLKTASYTVTGPLLLGAILAGANASQQQSIAEFATPIGVAFQLRDDLIGVFAPPERTGKPFASDVRAGKRTALVLECLRRVSPADARFLRRTLGNVDASTKDLRRFVALLESSGARARIEKRIRHHYAKGLERLASARLRPEGKALLASAAAALIQRDA